MGEAHFVCTPYAGGSGKDDEEYGQTRAHTQPAHSSNDERTVLLAGGSAANGHGDGINGHSTGLQPERPFAPPPRAPGDAVFTLDGDD